MIYLYLFLYLLCAFVRFSKERRWNPRRPVHKNHVFRSPAPLQFWVCRRVHHNKWRVRY